MKKLLFILNLCLFTSLFSQTSDSKQLTKMLEMSKTAKPATLDSIITQVAMLNKNSTDPVVKIAGPEVYLAILEMRDMKSSGAESIDYKTLTKEDLKNFRVENDDFKKTTFISRTGWGFQDWYAPYIVIKDNTIYLRWVLKYNGSRWLFMDKVSFIIDGKNYSFPINGKRNVLGGGSVSEVADLLVDDYILNVLKALSITQSQVKVRFEGENSQDYVITVKGAHKINDVLILYDKLKK